MCNDSPVSADENAQMDAQIGARCVALGEGTWVVGLTFGADHPARKRRPATRFHFVLDNSGSMAATRGMPRIASPTFWTLQMAHALLLPSRARLFCWEKTSEVSMPCEKSSCHDKVRRTSLLASKQQLM
jgi:hypothetical protein